MPYGDEEEVKDFYVTYTVQMKQHVTTIGADYDGINENDHAGAIKAALMADGIGDYDEMEFLGLTNAVETT